MARTVRREEIASMSTTDAPIFKFNDWSKRVQNQVYRNNGREIDFVTDDGNLYVCAVPEVNVDDNVTSAKEQSGLLLLVKKGEQGEQGVKGEPGLAGRTPSVFARFYSDSGQMEFYSIERDENNREVKKRIAVTNDLTGPSWKPELVNDTIVWHKTKDDENPKSIPLTSLIKQTSPVLFRVDTDNTRRMDEMNESGPANYIQWKYEGDEHWNNLISISELMNLTLAGVCIWFDETDQKYHLGHKMVEKATYAASHTGKQIITDVVHGETLYDAGSIPIKDWSSQINALSNKICEVESKIPKLRITEGKMLQISYDGGESWEDVGITCDCNLKKKWTVTIGTPIPADATMTANGKPVEPGDTLTVEDGDEVCITAAAEGYQNFEQCYTITDNITLTPELTPITSSYCARVVVTNDPNNEGHIWMSTNYRIRGEETKELCGLANGTTVYVSGERTGYIGFDNRKIIINNADGTLTVEWERDSSIPVEAVTINDCPGSIKVGNTSDISCSITPNTATNKNITWTSSDTNVATVSMKTPLSATITAKAKGTATITVTSDSDSSKKATCKITVTEDDTPTTYEVTANKNYAHCDVKPDTLGISTKSYADTTHTSLTLSGTNVLVYVKATKAGKKDKTWTTRVSGETEIYLGMYGSTCDWEDEEVTPTKYEVSIGNTCDADTAYLTKTKDGSSIGQTYQADENEIVWLHAEKSGKKDINKSSGMIKNNYPFVINCDEWKDETEPEIEVTEISLDKSTMSLTYASCDGHTYGTTSGTLTATISPSDATNKNVNWTTDNSSVATVSEGIVTAKGVGTATITATAKGNTSKTATCRVTVTAASVPATGISLKEQTTLVVGGTETLEATLTPSCSTSTVTWSSSDTNIATVSDGTIEGVAPGTATITAEANGKTATCEVTVKAASEDCTITSFSISPKSMSLTPGGQRGTLTATIGTSGDCTDADKAITFKGYDATIISITKEQNSWMVDPVNPGTTTITAYCGDLTDTCEVIVNCVVSQITFKEGDTVIPNDSILMPSESAKIITVETNCDNSEWSISCTAPSSSVTVEKVTGSSNTFRINPNRDYCGTFQVSITSGSITKSLTVTAGSITITDPVQITAGETYQLEPSTCIPNATFDYSANSQYFTVNNTGLISAVASGGGTVNITVHGTNISKSITVNVVSVPSISNFEHGCGGDCGLSKPQYITFNLTLPQSTTVSYTLYDSNLYDESDPTAGRQWGENNVSLTSGSHTITSTCNQWSWTKGAGQSDPQALLIVYVNGTKYGPYYSELSTCQEEEICVDSITLNNVTREIYEGSTTLISATISPNDADNKTLSWNSDAPLVASVDANGLVTGLSAGVANITAKATDSCEVSSTPCVVTVKELPDITVNVVNNTRSNTVTFAMAGTSYDESEALDTNIAYNNSKAFTVTPLGSLYVYGLADPNNQEVKCGLNGINYSKPYNQNYIEIPYNQFIKGETNTVTVTLA